MFPLFGKGGTGQLEKAAEYNGTLLVSYPIITSGYPWNKPGELFQILFQNLLKLTNSVQICNINLAFSYVSNSGEDDKVLPEG